MPLSTGDKLGPYEILAAIGEGGMGAVYRATDTKLNRDVAVKVLPDAFANDPDRLARFTREAQILASLNHPNIATIFGIEERAIIMELVGGPTLADRIAAGPVPLDEAVPVARQIAEALEAAHEKGITHRDLKPANVKITLDGRVKVLDFGLAKLADAPAPDPAHDVASAPTVVRATSPTIAGAIVGTAAYMAPEQAAGKPVDKRADIWSFGVVLWEMLCGRALFEGETVSHILADVLRGPIDLNQLPKDTPRALRELLRRCLQRDVRQRLRDIGEARVLLESPLIEPPAPPTPPAEATRRTRWVWPAIAALAAVTAVVGWWPRQDSQFLPDLALTRLTFDPGLTFSPAISPDGKLIAFSSDRAGRGDLDIWVQHRTGGAAIRVTQDASDEFDPSFSPDGSQIVFARTRGLYIVPALGGEPRRLVRTGGAHPRFSPDGKRIVFDVAAGGNPTGQKIYLFEIGSQEAKVVSGDVTGCHSPIWSPDGKHILFAGGRRRDSQWWLVAADGGTPVPLGPVPGIPQQWLDHDRILALEGAVSERGQRNNLSLVRIATSKATIIDKPRRLLGGPVRLDAASIAVDGTLVVAAVSFQSNLWSLPINPQAVKALGEPQPLTRDLAFSAYPSISADGKKLDYLSNASGVDKIWLMEMETGRRRLVTPTPEPESRPILSPDGTLVAFRAPNAAMVADVSSMEQPGAARPACDTCGPNWDWFWDNRGFLTNSSAGRGIWMAGRQGPPLHFIPSDRLIYQAHPSPDGQWLLVMQGGQMHIARILGDKVAPQQEWKRIVEGGSDLYRWSPDGNTAYFISSRDEFRCIWAQRLKPDNKEPVGDPVAIYHPHGARLSMTAFTDGGAVGLGVSRDKLAFAQLERTGNIWVGKLNEAK